MSHRHAPADVRPMTPAAASSPMVRVTLAMHMRGMMSCASTTLLTPTSRICVASARLNTAGAPNVVQRMGPKASGAPCRMHIHMSVQRGLG